MLIVPNSNSQPWTPGNLLEAFPPPKAKAKAKKRPVPPVEPEPEAAADDAPEAPRSRRPVAPPPRRAAAPPPRQAAPPPRPQATSVPPQPTAAPARRPAPPPAREPVPPPARDPVDYEPAPGEGEDDTEVTDDEDLGEPVTEPPPARKREYLMKKKRRPRPVIAEAHTGPERHSAKAHRCVDEVTAKGGVDEPWAVCTASIGKAGVYAKGHGGSASPKRRTRETEAALDALVEAMVNELRG